MRGGLFDNDKNHRHVGSVVHAYADSLVINKASTRDKGKKQEKPVVLWRPYIMSIDILDQSGLVAGEQFRLCRSKSLPVAARVRNWICYNPCIFSSRELFVELDLSKEDRRAMLAALSRMEKAGKIKRIDPGVYDGTLIKKTDVMGQRIWNGVVAS